MNNNLEIRLNDLHDEDEKAHAAAESNRENPVLVEGLENEVLPFIKGIIDDGSLQMYGDYNGKGSHAKFRFENEKVIGQNLQPMNGGLEISFLVKEDAGGVAASHESQNEKYTNIQIALDGEYRKKLISLIQRDVQQLEKDLTEASGNQDVSTIQGMITSLENSIYEIDPEIGSI